MASNNIGPALRLGLCLALLGLCGSPSLAAPRYQRPSSTPPQAKANKARPKAKPLNRSKPVTVPLHLVLSIMQSQAPIRDQQICLYRQLIWETSPREASEIGLEAPHRDPACQKQKKRRRPL